MADAPMKKLLAILLLASSCFGVTTSQLQTQINSLTDRITKDEAAISQLQTAQSQTTQSIQAIQTLISGLQADMTAAKAAIATLQQQMTQAQADIQVLKGGATPPPTTDPPPSADPGTTTPPPTTTACTGTAITGAGILNVPGGKYYLANDVTAGQTAFSVQASGITVDLCGHTVTYGTANTTNRRHAFMGEACWDAQTDGNPCDGKFDHFTIYSSVPGAKLVQGGGGPYSHAIHFGRGGANNLTASGFEIDVNGDSAKAVFTNEAGGQNVHDLLVVSTGKTIQDRHQLDGVLIHFANNNTSTYQPSIVYNNKIRGSVQGGIVTWAPNSKVYNNDIQLNAYYTNDFCVYAYGSGMEVYGNVCDNTQGTNMGRGIHVTAANVSIHDNVVRVRELPRNAEYNGCESGGAYGIQFEGGSGVHFQNSITAIATSCDATGLRISGGTLTSPSTANGYSESVKAIRESGTSTGRAIGITTREANGYKLRDSVFTVGKYFWTDVSQLQTSTTPPTNSTFTNITVIKDTVYPDPAFRTWRPENYGQTATLTATGMTFVGAKDIDVFGSIINGFYKQYTLYLNGQYKVFNTPTQGVVIQQIQ